MNYPACIRVLCCFTLVAAYGYRVYSQTRGSIPLSKECCRLIPSEPNEGDCCLLKFPDARFHDFFTDEQVSKRFQSVGVPTCCGTVRANDGDEWVCARLTGSTSATAKTLDGRVFVPEELLTVLKLDEGRYLAVAPPKKTVLLTYSCSKGQLTVSLLFELIAVSASIRGFRAMAH